MSTLAILEDAIAWQGGALPDELCPLYLVDAGRRLGGDAAAVAEVALREHREGWFGRYDPEAIWQTLTKKRAKRLLKRLEVEEAVWFQVQSEGQLREAWGEEVAAYVTVSASPSVGGHRGYGFLHTFSKTSQAGGVFAVTTHPQQPGWVGDQREGRTMTAPLHSSVLPPERVMPCPVGWEYRRGLYGRIVRDWRHTQASRQARDAVRRSRAEEAGVVHGGGGGT